MVTRPGTNHLDQAPGPASADDDGGHAELVERLRRNAVQLLADVAVPPRSLRLRAGQVAVDIEWAEQPVAPAPPAPPEPSGESRPAFGRDGTKPAATSNGGPALRYVTAPTVGTFYRAPEPGAAPFVGEGDTVTAGQQVAIVEAMKLMIAVHADVAGRVVEVLKADGESVEYGERLIAVDDAEAG